MYAQCTWYKNIPTYNMCVSNECVRTHGERSVQWSGIEKCFTTISYKIAAMRVTKELRRTVKIVRARALLSHAFDGASAPRELSTTECDMDMSGTPKMSTLPRSLAGWLISTWLSWFIQKALISAMGRGKFDFHYSVTLCNILRRIKMDVWI